MIKNIRKLLKSFRKLKNFIFLLTVFLNFIPSAFSNEYKMEECAPEMEQPAPLPRADYSFRANTYCENDYFNTGSNPPDSEYCRRPWDISLIFDQRFSQVVGAEALITSLNAYKTLDDTFIPCSEGDTEFYMVAGRFTKWALEGVLFSTGMVTQHEVFGHGARAREFKLHIEGYGIRPFHGFTEFNTAAYNRLPISERIAIDAGGMEGTGILAKRIRDRWLETKCIDERDAHFYLINIFDQTEYVLNTKRDRTFSEGNDVLAYVKHVNDWYGRQVLTSRRLRHQILFDLIDPYFFYSLYSFGNYIVDGTQEIEYPMIPLGDYHYLPGMRIALAPYGPEYQLINYIRSPERTIQATLRYGKTGIKQSQGFTLEATKIWCSDLLNFDGRIDLWHQPKLYVARVSESSRKFGAAASLIARYRFTSCFELKGQLGYKTTGYIPGEPLKHGIIARIGFLMQI